MFQCTQYVNLLAMSDIPLKYEFHYARLAVLFILVVFTYQLKTVILKQLSVHNSTSFILKHFSQNCESVFLSSYSGNQALVLRTLH